MAYRQDARDDTLRGRFWYGPFTPTGWGLGSLAALVVIAPLAIGVATLEETLECDRSNGICRFDRRELMGTIRSARFPLADVVEVRWVPGSGKGSGQAESVLVMRSGKDKRLASQSKADAEVRHGRLEQFFAGGGGAHLRERWTTGPITKLVLFGLALFTAVAAVAGLKMSLPLRVEVRGDSVRIRRRRRTLDVSDATRVRVDIGPEPKKLGHVVIETRHGDERLLDEGRAGTAAHQRVARALAKLLSLEVDVGPEAAPWLKMPRLPKKLPRSLYLILGGTVLVTAIGTVLVLIEVKTGGTLDLECRGRCRFQNMECLPGGRVTTSLTPGDYVIETWAPDEPTHWKKNVVRIQVGGTEHFVCPAEVTR